GGGPNGTIKRGGASLGGGNGRHGEDKLPHAQDHITRRKGRPERLADQLAPSRLLFRRQVTEGTLHRWLFASVLDRAGHPGGRLGFLLDGGQRFALGGRQGERRAYPGILERPQAALLKEDLVQSPNLRGAEQRHGLPFEVFALGTLPVPLVALGLQLEDRSHLLLAQLQLLLDRRQPEQAQPAIDRNEMERALAIAEGQGHARGPVPDGLCVAPLADRLEERGDARVSLQQLLACQVVVVQLIEKVLVVGESGLQQLAAELR